jgi:hypothetical protein
VPVVLPIVLAPRVKRVRIEEPVVPVVPVAPVAPVADDLEALLSSDWMAGIFTREELDFLLD